MSFKVKQYEFETSRGDSIIFELGEDIFELHTYGYNGELTFAALFDKKDIQELINLLDYIQTELNG